MKLLKKTILLSLIVLLTNSCIKKTSKEYNHDIYNPDIYHKCVNQLTDVIIHDIFTPPVASRIYSYATLAGYEAMVSGDKKYPSMAGKIQDFAAVPKPQIDKEYCFPLAGVKAFMTVARGLTFSIEKYDDFEKSLDKKFKDAGVPSEVIERSVAYGQSIGKVVLDYAKNDKYPQTRGLRYTLQNKPGTWQPTPPPYADAVEPNWGVIRPMVIDSSTQFMPPPPFKYDLAKNSAFMKEVMEVYEMGKNLTEEQKRIAWFWDDNAFVMNVQGHMMFADKKMTPGGHWLAIVKTVCQDKKVDLMKSAQAYLLVSIALRDAFIVCWEGKYRYHKIRPETVINASVDTKWNPFLQTPPFPEYPGGHSTISGASTEVLTQLFGDNIAFTDSTEAKFGHGVGQFQSFYEAGNQASISRVYGGIHFRSACDEGFKSGIEIGKWVMLKASK
ncbi:vanadium-dependent haloperoxidase [Emticicia sp. SJ17W-69]|uniref:vanadium-dependent haloperoxidase n=1 Tax=Emticicia sp. SJ17W-69 TaxID=3421657 RepID=UPI003EBAF984